MSAPSLNTFKHKLDNYYWIQKTFYDNKQVNSQQALLV